MKTLFDKAASTLSGVALVCIGGLMAAIGLSVVALLAMFGLAAAGLALLAAPFVAASTRDRQEDDRAQAAATA